MDLLVAIQDQVCRPPLLHESFPSEETEEGGLPYLLALHFVGLEAKALFQGLQGVAFGSVFDLDHCSPLSQPVVRHLACIPSMAHPVKRPVVLVAPSEEAVVYL